MNHMAVMFKKSAVLKAGNYQPLPGYEDYYLWVRMLVKGFKAANIQENIVFARIGNNMLARRKGFKFFKQEFELQKKFYQIGFVSFSQAVLNVFLRATTRLFPTGLLKYGYKFLRK